MKTVTILVPCYNEEQSLPMFYEATTAVTSQLTNYQWEFLFVNDGSKDKTLEMLMNLRRQHGVNVLNLSRNYGKENAMLAGFDYAKGDAMIIMDADLQDPPTIIPMMIERWEQGFEDVYAQRKDRGKESWLRKQLSLAYYRMLNRVADINVLPNVGDFRLLDRKCIDALKQLREANRYTKGMFCYIGFKKSCIEFDRGDRVAGHSNMSFRILLRLAIDGLMSYTTAPLRIAVWFGLIVALGAFVYMLFIFIRTLLFGDPVAGFPALMDVILFLGGVQLLCIGIVGQYLGQVYIETKHRPVYFVESYNE